MAEKAFLVTLIAIAAFAVFSALNLLLQRVRVPWPIRAVLWIAIPIVLIPFFVEPGMTRPADGIVMGIGFGGLALGCLVARWNARVAARK
ncbi:MAG TPA: hypothetical protein VFC90_05040 [Planctomycetota bacterium]|nr:hypothetical protein [Planctomycetota bacterium]